MHCRTQEFVVEARRVIKLRHHHLGLLYYSWDDLVQSVLYERRSSINLYGTAPY